MNVYKICLNKTRIAGLLVIVVFASFLIVSCAEEFESPSTTTGTTIAEIAATDTTLEIFTAVLGKTGLGISLGAINSGQHTVFAPTDSAFRVYFKASAPAPASNYNTDAGVIAYLNTMSPTSTIVLSSFIAQMQYHIVSSKATFADITNSKVFTSIAGPRLSLSKVGSTVMVNGNVGNTGAKSRKTDLIASNGVIHTINKFLTAISTSTTAGAASVVTSTGFGLGLTVSYATTPPTVTNGATGGGNYDLFALGIKKTALGATIRPNVAAGSLPDFTFFVPSDAAMVTHLGVADEAAAVTFINALSGTDSIAFQGVLKYHIVPGRVLTTDLVVGEDLTTLVTGKVISVAAGPVLKDAQAVPGSANIVGGGNVLSNAGVLHRIDAVLKPN